MRGWSCIGREVTRALFKQKFRIGATGTPTFPDQYILVVEKRRLTAGLFLRTTGKDNVDVSLKIRGGRVAELVQGLRPCTLSEDPSSITSSHIR